MRARKELCMEFQPGHVYQSVLNFTFPDRVTHKTKSNYSYPFRTSEYVVDVDSYLAYAPHSHRTRNSEPCEGCIQNAYDLTMIILEEVEENYSDIRLIFSGRQGFHINVFARAARTPERFFILFFLSGAPKYIGCRF